MKTFSAIVCLLLMACSNGGAEAAPAKAKKTENGKLTRALAKELIVKSNPYPKSVLRTVWEGEDNYDTSGIARQYQVVDLIESGMMQAELVRSENVMGQFMRYRSRLSVTPEGRKHFFKLDAEGQHFRACKEQFGEITGIVENEGKTEAKVEYTTTVSDVTPFGENYRTRFGDSVCQPGKVSRETANFQKYDDGWRMIAR